MVTMINPAEFASLGAILSNNTSALSLPSRLETAASELQVIDAYGVQGWTDMSESLRGASVESAFQAIERIPEIITPSERQRLYARLSSGDTKSFLASAKALQQQLETQLPKIKSAHAKEIAANLEKIRWVVSAGRQVPAGVSNAVKEPAYDPTRALAKQNGVIQHGPIRIDYFRRRVWVKDCRTGAAGQLGSLWSPVKIHHTPTDGQKASVTKLTPGVPYPLGPEDHVRFQGEVVPIQTVKPQITRLARDIQNTSSLHQLMTLMQSAGYSSFASQIENFLRSRTPITVVPNEEGLAQKLDQLILGFEFQDIARRYYPNQYPEIAFNMASAAVQAVAAAPTLGALLNVPIPGIEAGLRAYFSNPNYQTAAAIPVDFGLQSKAIALMASRFAPPPAPVPIPAPAPVPAPVRKSRTQTLILGVPPPAPPPTPAPVRQAAGSTIPWNNLFTEPMAAKIKGESALLDARGQPSGHAYLVCGGEEDNVSLKLSDGSIISAQTSRGTRPEQQDGFLVAWFRMADGSLVKLIASSDGAGGAARGELASSAFLQGVYQKFVEAAAKGIVPPASELFAIGVKAVQKQSELHRAVGATGTASVTVIHGNNADAATIADNMTLHAARRGMYFAPKGYSEIQNIADNRIIAGIHGGGGKNCRIKLRAKDRLAHGSDGFWQNILGVAYKERGSPQMRAIHKATYNQEVPPPDKTLFAAICNLFQATVGDDRAAQKMFALALQNQTTPGQEVELNGVTIKLPNDSDSDNIVVVTYEHPEIPELYPMPAWLMALPELEKIAA